MKWIRNLDLIIFMKLSSKVRMCHWRTQPTHSLTIVKIALHKHPSMSTWKSRRIDSSTNDKSSTILEFQQKEDGTPVPMQHLEKRMDLVSLSYEGRYNLSAPLFFVETKKTFYRRTFKLHRRRNTENTTRS